MIRGLSNRRLHTPLPRCTCAVTYCTVFYCTVFYCTLASIGLYPLENQASAQTQSRGSGSARTSDHASSAVNRNQDNTPLQNGLGGGSFADFQSLIDLIQSTVVPDTWEALGGPSTMAPYPQGIYVDPSGMLLDCQPLDLVDLGNPQLPLKLSADQGFAPLGTLSDETWKQSSPLRFVSLKRLSSQWNRWQQSGRSPSEAMRNLAGLSEVQHVFFDDADIVLAGPVSGITRHQGWYRDAASKRNTLQLDFLRVTLWSSLNRQPFGCTIDPTREGLQEAALVGREIQQQEIKLSEAKDSLVSALGMQRVEVFGIPGNTPSGYIMVEADRHMKRLALGDLEMPENAKNYLDAIDEAISEGPPQELLLRLWFTSRPREVFTNEEKSAFKLIGHPIRLSSENERAQLNGDRGAITVDIRTESFVRSFNAHWQEIRETYAIYGAAESIFEAASIAELMNRFAMTPEHRRIIEILANQATVSHAVLPTPRKVASIGTLHTVRHQGKRHHVLLASGGVMVNPTNSLDEIIVRYPRTVSLDSRLQERPKVEQRWWWDASEKPQNVPSNSLQNNKD